MLVEHFPSDARIEYKVVPDGTFLVDPLNPETEMGGFGPNSVLTMPDYVYSDYVVHRDDITHGTLSDDFILPSQHLGYGVAFWVYTPAGYDDMDELPVIYVTDGHEYIDLAYMPDVLDNLIAEGEIEPVIAVLIDPRDPESGQNRREEQFIRNADFDLFITEELVPAIDSSFDTDPSPDARAILGTSYGGFHAANFALHHSDTFHLIGIQSPALWRDMSILDQYRQMERLPIKVFLSVGTLGDSTEDTQALRDVLEAKDYPLLYVESNQGHTWGNWRDKLDDVLIYFFGGE